MIRSGQVPVDRPADESDEASAAVEHAERSRLCHVAISLRETASAHFILGSIYRQRQQWDFSMAHLEAAVKLQPKWAPIRANLGAAYLRQGRLNRYLRGAGRQRLYLDRAELRRLTKIRMVKRTQG